MKVINLNLNKAERCISLVLWHPRTFLVQTKTSQSVDRWLWGRIPETLDVGKIFTEHWRRSRGDMLQILPFIKHAT